MERIDLYQPRFAPAEVLRLVPTLTAKTLMNWNDLRVFEVYEPTPGRGRPRRYTPAGIIVLSFMARITTLGIGPAAAYGMGKTLLEHAERLHALYPAEEENGRLAWTIYGLVPEGYRRGYVVKFKDEHVLLIEKEELGVTRTTMPDVYVTVEVDFLILAALERIYAFLAGEPTTGEAEGTPGMESITELLRDLRSPGGGS